MGIRASRPRGDIDASSDETPTALSQPPRVIIVGGGPVGLMIAYWMARQGSGVVLWEPRAHFTRRQILYMSSEFWELVPDPVRQSLGANGGCAYDQNPMICSPTKGKYVNILLGTFQEQMLAFLRSDFGDKIQVTPTAATLEQVELAARAATQDGQECAIVVADGGGRTSLVHELWARDQGPEQGGKPAFQYIHASNAAVVTFDANVAPPEELDAATAALLFVDEPKQRAGVAFRTLPNAAYIGVQLTDATTADLMRLDPAQLLPAFLQTAEGDLYKTLLARAGYRDVRGEAISVFPIHLKTARQFYYRLASAHVFVLGDAAFTTHFFTGTGMNRGLEVGKNLVDMLAQQPPSEWPSYEQMVAAIRNALWDNVVPLWLPDMARAIAVCSAKHGPGDDRSICTLEQSRTLTDQAAVGRVQQRIYLET